MGGISFQYPAWFVLICVLVGLAYAMVLYYRDRSFREKSSWLNWVLGGVRFLGVTLICLLLLSPLLKSFLTDVKKPVVVIAQDASESVVNKMDEEDINQLQADLENLESSLSENFEVKSFSFGSEFREGYDFSFSDKVSNLSEMIQGVYDLYSNQNLGAIVLATDGIYNEGSNPIYSSDKIAAPIFSIAMGDTTVKKDLILKRVFHNKIAYLGDRFIIQVDISGRNAAGSNTKLNISKIEGGRVRKLEEVTVNVNQNDFFTTKEIVLEANKSGVQRYRINLSPVSGEESTTNNAKDIFIDVLDARQKILLLANAPHPDISALKQSISDNKNYEVKVEYLKNFTGNVSEYNFVILHQIPSRSIDASSLLGQIKNQQIPHLFILGAQSDLRNFNSVQSLLSISVGGNNTNEVQAFLNKSFSLFKVNEDVRKNLPQFAPLVSPFGDYTVAANADVFLYQQIGKVETEYPLLLFGEDKGLKVGVLCAEGIWKWRLFDYLQHQNHEIFDEVLSKSIQYLALKEDKRKFRVTLAKNIFNENEPILLDAELYNESYELINEPDVSLEIKNNEGKSFSFIFNRSESTYSLNAGFFPVGNYTYTGKVNYNGNTLTHNGQFSVQPIQLEAFETTANHAILRLLSQENGGGVVGPSNIASLTQLVQDKDIKPRIYQTTKTRSIIHLKWIFFVLLFLLVLEWFMRRYHGGY